MRTPRFFLILLLLFLNLSPIYGAESARLIIGIDISGSMRGDDLANTISAAQQLVINSTNSRDFEIYTFARTIQRIKGSAELTELKSGGYTALYDSIFDLAVQAVKSRASLIMLTDGQDSRSQRSLIELLSELSSLPLQIDFIAVQPKAEDLEGLAKIAQLTGGRVVNVSQVSQLIPTLEDSISASSVPERDSNRGAWIAISGISGVLSLSILQIYQRWRRRENSLDKWDALLDEFELKPLEKTVGTFARIPIRSFWVRIVGNTGLIAPRLSGRTQREFLLAITLLTLFSGLIILGLPFTFAFVITIPVTILALRALVKRAEWRERMSFENELPGALKLIASSLTAGLSFLQSLDTFSSESHTQVSKEFRRALSEIQMGSPVERALGDVADRMESEDLRWVVFAFSVQREVGGSLAKILQTSAETIESRANLRQEVRTLSAEGRISSYILMLLPPGIFLFLAITRPNFIALFWRESIGHILIAIVIVLIILAWVWIRRLIRVTV